MSEREAREGLGDRDAVEAVTNGLHDWILTDLSHRYEVGMPRYPGHPRYYHELWDSYNEGGTAVLYQMLIHEHCGTHVDAPAHFVRDGPAHKWVDEVNIRGFAGRAACLRAEGTGSAIDLSLLKEFERHYGDVGCGDIVLVSTGWGRLWSVGGGPWEYCANWPALTPRLVDELVLRGVAAVGCDTLSPDPEDSEDFYAHHNLLGREVPIFENLTNLDRLGPWSLFVAMPLKIGEGSGSPVRAVAWSPPRQNAGVV